MFSILAATESEIDAQKKLRVQFRNRALGVRDKLNDFSCCASGLTLGNVRWHGNGRPPHLRYQAKLFVAWEDPGDFVNHLHQSHTFLPNYQVLIAHRPGILVGRALLLFRNHVQLLTSTSKGLHLSHVTRHTSLLNARPCARHTSQVTRHSYIPTLRSPPATDTAQTPARCGTWSRHSPPAPAPEYCGQR